MDQAYQTPAPGDAGARPGPEPLAIRRHTDRCFFAVEEVVEEADGSLRGYIVEGMLIDKDDVAQVRRGRHTCNPEQAPHTPRH